MKINELSALKNQIPGIIKKLLLLLIITNVNSKYNCQTAYLFDLKAANYLSLHHSL